MFRYAIVGIAGFALACAPLVAAEKQDANEQSGRYLLASGGSSNCPVYYGCPAPAPAPKGGNSGGGNSGGGNSGGGNKSADPSQTPALVASGGSSNCPVYYGCPAPAPAPKGGNSGGGNSGSGNSGGGNKSADPSQTPALVASGGSSNCPVYYGCPAPAPAPKGGNSGGGNSSGGNSGGGNKSADPSQTPALKA